MTSLGKPSLRRNVIYSALANAIFSFTQWGIVAVVVHWGHSEQVGAITVVTALITPIFMFAQMAMRDGLSVDDLDHFSQADYIALRAVSSFIAVLASALLILFYLAPSGEMVQLAGLAYVFVKLMGSQTNMNHGIFQRAEKLDFVALSMLSRGVFGFAFFACAFYYSRDLGVAFFAEALAWSAGFFLIDRPLLARMGARTKFHEVIGADPRKVLQLAKWMLPLGVAILLMNAAASVPRLALERSASLSVVGVFGAIAYLNVALNIFSSSIGTASASRMRRQFRSGKKGKFIKLTAELLAACGVLGLSLIFAASYWGKEALELIYGSNYARSDVLTITVAAAALRILAAPLQFAMNAGQAFGKRMQNSVVTFAAAVAAALLLIPSFGVIGAAWALFVQSAVNLVSTLLSFGRLVLSMGPAVPEVKENP